MKYIFLWVALFWGLPSSLLAQKEDYSWVIPRNSVIHFTDSIPWIENWPWRSYEGFESNSSLSDGLGNLIMYSDAIFWQRPFFPDTIWKNRSTIRNAKRDTILNGDDINMDATITNGSFFIKSGKKIYLLHLCTWYVSPPPTSWHDSLTNIKLFMTVIEQKDSHWVVTEKNKLLSYKLRLVEKLTAVRHANGQDWWIITHDWKDNIFHTFLFSEGEIKDSFSQRTGQSFKEVGKEDNEFYIGEIAVSSDGSKLLLANTADWETRDYGAELFHFDRCCGKISFWKGLKSRYYGAAFSPNGKFLYLSKDYGHTYQYEIDAQYLQNTEVQVSPHPYIKEWGFGGGQLEPGPDGRIYCASQSSRYIGAILYPDRKGIECEFKPDFIPYGKDGSGDLGLPSFPNYRLGAKAPTYYRHDTTVCPDKKTAIGIPTDCDYAYEWSPATGLSDTTTATPTVKINQDMTYIRRTFSARFGCTLRYDTFFVKVLEKTIPPCTSDARPETNTEKTFTMYPNPAQETVTIRYPVQNHDHLTLLDITGRKLLSFRLNSSGEHTLDVSTLPEGIYILKAGDRFSEKLVIVR